MYSLRPAETGASASSSVCVLVTAPCQCLINTPFQNNLTSLALPASPCDESFCAPSTAMVTLTCRSVTGEEPLGGSVFTDTVGRRLSKLDRVGAVDLPFPSRESSRSPGL